MFCQSIIQSMASGSFHFSGIMLPRSICEHVFCGHMSPFSLGFSITGIARNFTSSSRVQGSSFSASLKMLVLIFLGDYSPCGFEGDFIVSSVLCFPVTNDAAHLFICLWTNFTSLEKCSSDPLSFCKWDGFSFLALNCMRYL